MALSPRDSWIGDKCGAGTERGEKTWPPERSQQEARRSEKPQRSESEANWEKRDERGEMKKPKSISRGDFFGLVCFVFFCLTVSTCLGTNSLAKWERLRPRTPMQKVQLTQKGYIQVRVGEIEESLLKVEIRGTVSEGRFFREFFRICTNIFSGITFTGLIEEWYS